MKYGWISIINDDSHFKPPQLNRPFKINWIAKDKRSVTLGKHLVEAAEIIQAEKHDSKLEQMPLSANTIRDT